MDTLTTAFRSGKICLCAINCITSPTNFAYERPTVLVKPPSTSFPAQSPRKRRRLALLAAYVIVSLAGATGATAADLGGNCCADLEERIAELEATTARKGNRKVSLSIAGHINQSILAWDDGVERNTYVVGNKNDQSNVALKGEARIHSGLTAGYNLTIRLRDTLTDEVSQTTDDPGNGFVIWQSHVFLESKTLGKLTLGQASRVSDTAPESDLSEAAVAAFAGVEEIGGAFGLRRRDGSLSTLSWGDIVNNFNGDTANVVRYDTPELHGFVASASWGEDDIWDVGLKYEGEGAGLKIAATVAYTRTTDQNGLDGGGDIANSTVVGSVAILHAASGVNALVAAGHRRFDERVLDADASQRRPADPRYIYAKLGWIAKLSALGPTAFYGEYGRFDDFLSAGTDPVDIDAATAAVRVVGSRADIWGLGVVQHIEAAEMQIYLGYRRYSADFELVDGTGASTAAAGVRDFDTVIAGSKIAF